MTVALGPVSLMFTLVRRGRTFVVRGYRCRAVVPVQVGCRRGVGFRSVRVSCAPWRVSDGGGEGGQDDDGDFRVTLFGDVSVSIRPSARRHGVGVAVIFHAIENAIVVAAPDVDDRNVDVVIGPGPAGDLFEVLVRHAPAGPVVFHAMPLRRSTARRLWGDR